ncbi:AAA family ATPase [Brucella intermedia GD04153]|uniref:AAA family ATPase n=1 Tax=Brucella intermedia GD04153 TaxID=2975438 RepID=A0AA42KTD9_9HYPH|nr:AAA family ATPase [Brucella intermedia]MDH0125770.1 AAA family ATPase [Brucella intermedia GD04153]
MRIESFYAHGIHGYLNFELSFNHDLSFLTGINGSGKTSSLNSIVALLSPDLSTLANLEFNYIAVEITHDNKTFQVYSQSYDENISLGITGLDEVFSFTPFSPNLDLPSYRQFEGEQDYYREIASLRASHPVLRMLAGLPKPMFLGIDRRSTLGLSRHEAWRGRQLRFGKNIFGQTLATSVAAAAELAVQRYRDAVIQAGKLTERLQREVLLGFLGDDVSAYQEAFSLKLPTKNDLKELRKIRNDIDSIATMMQLPITEVRKRLLPLLQRLESLATQIPTETEFDTMIRLGKDQPELLSAVAGWSANQSHLERIRFISEKVAGYNRLRTEILAPTRKYEELVNGFLYDSGKRIQLVDDGSMEVHIQGVDGARTISSLSSGEAQIFVILTHLAFNPSAQKDNVFIIDEPELSLHLQWQEMFVESIIKANPNIQYILATHSPSIVLDRIDKCIEASSLGGGE